MNDNITFSVLEASRLFLELHRDRSVFSDEGISKNIYGIPRIRYPDVPVFSIADKALLSNKSTNAVLDSTVIREGCGDFYFDTFLRELPRGFPAVHVGYLYLVALWEFGWFKADRLLLQVIKRVHAVVPGDLVPNSELAITDCNMRILKRLAYEGHSDRLCFAFYDSIMDTLHADYRSSFKFAKFAFQIAYTASNVLRRVVDRGI